jgi:heme exporter protein A
MTEGLACRRGGRRVFSKLDLRVDSGQAVWLRGPNGCGKTSLLRILAGLAQPDGGALRTGSPAGIPEGKPAFIGHRNALNEDLSAGEALAFLCGLRGTPPSRAALSEALGRFGLSHRLATPVRVLSQGQRRKVALARLWLDTAAVWLLDEPYDALDQFGSAVLDDALTAHLQRGGSVVMTSHQPVTLPGVRSFMMPEPAAARPAARRAGAQVVQEAQ